MVTPLKLAQALAVSANAVLFGAYFPPTRSKVKVLSVADGLLPTAQVELPKFQTAFFSFTTVLFYSEAQTAASVHPQKVQTHGVRDLQKTDPRSEGNTLTAAPSLLVVPCLKN